jgi:hypothetical protein
VNRSFTTAVERTTNDSGSCYFERIPKDVYEVHVVESSEYSSASKQVSLFQEDAASVNMYIPVSSKTVCCFTVFVRDFETNLEVSGAKATLTAGSELALSEVSRGLYQVSVKFGDYFLTIEHKGHQLSERKVTIYQQSCELKELLVQEKKRFVEVRTVDAVTGEQVNGLLQMFVEGTKTPHEGMTEHGKFKFQLEQFGPATLQANMSGYIEIRRSVITSERESSFTLALMQASYSPLVLVVTTDRVLGELVVTDDSAPSSRKFSSSGVALVSCKSKHTWLRVGITFDQPSSMVAHLYTEQRLVGEFSPPQVRGSHWDIMALAERRYIAIGTMAAAAPSHNKSHLLDFAQMGQVVLKADATIESIFGFDLPETPVTHKGSESYINPLILHQLFEGEVSKSAVDYLVEGLDTGVGVSLGSLKQCFGGRECKAEPFHVVSVEELALQIGLNLPADAKYLYIAEEALEQPLPKGWEYRYGDTWIYYETDTAEYSHEHPNLVQFRAKLIEAKHEEVEHEYSEEEEMNMSESVSDTGYEERLASHIQDLKKKTKKWVSPTQAKHDKSSEQQQNLLSLVAEARATLEQMVRTRQTGLEAKEKYLKVLKKAEKRLTS